MASPTGVYDVTLGVCFLWWIIQVELPQIKRNRKEKDGTLLFYLLYINNFMLIDLRAPHTNAHK